MNQEVMMSKKLITMIKLESQNYKYKSRINSLKLLIFMSVALQIANLLKETRAAGSIFDEANESQNHDPEKQTDGSLMSLHFNPSINHWNNGQGDANAQHTIVPMKKSIQRRGDERDFEDNFDDDERDEDKSGSSHHDSIREPEFGESQKSAKEGDEIEHFFDKHLGPQDPVVSNEDHKESHSKSVKPAVIERADPDDRYEMAASRPLTDIFHNLIKAHKRPLVIHATEDSPASSQVKLNETRQIQQPQSPQQQQQLTAASMGVQQLSQLGPHRFVQGSPFIDNSMPPNGIATAMNPVNYYGPMSAASMPYGYEQGTPQFGPPNTGPMVASSSSEDYSGPAVREIYIARRPTVLQHLRTHAAVIGPPIQRLVQQSSNAHWRGMPMSGGPIQYPNMEQSAASNDYPNHYHQHRYLQEQSMFRNNMRGYPPVPYAAHSFAREQAQRAEANKVASSTEADEPETVSYGLSFGGSSLLGGHSSAGSDADETNEDGPGVNEQSSAVDEPQVPYHAGSAAYNYRGPAYNRYASSGSQAYNNYNYPVPMMRAGDHSIYPPVQQVPQAMSPIHYQSQPQQAQHQYQHNYNGARYHKDPSESVVQPVNYPQYSPMSSGSTPGDYESWVTRQKLLANLDQEIKNNQHYRQNVAPMPVTNFREQPQSQQQALAPVSFERSFKTRLNKDASDVDTYSSFHSEVDPYKSFTASAKLVNEPRGNGKQRGEHDTDSTANNDAMDTAAATRSQASESILKQLDGNFGNFTDNRNCKSAKSGSNHNAQEMRTGPNETFNNQTRQASPRNLFTGPVARDPKNQQPQNQQPKPRSSETTSHINHRVRREDAEDRENDEVDDDGVWVDDDEDDDNRQTASDVNQTTREPEEDESQQDNSSRVQGLIGNPHGYEISPLDS